MYQSPLLQPTAKLASATILLLWSAGHVISSLTSNTFHERGRLMLVILLASAYGSYIFVKQLNFQRRARAKGCLPVNTVRTWDPILGIDGFLQDLMATAAYKLPLLQMSRHAKAGHTYAMNRFGRTVLATDDPENVKAMLGTNFDDWGITGSRLHGPAQMLGYNGITASNGARWKAARAMLRPGFVRDELSNLERFNRHIDNLLDVLPGEGETFDILQLALKMTMDSSTDFVFGYSTDTLRSPSAEAADFVIAFERGSEEGTRRGLLGLTGWAEPFLGPQLKRDKATVDAFVDRYVQKALAEGLASNKEKSYVFLNELIKMKPTHQEICDHMLSIIIAGRDTSGISLAAIFYFLARCPRAVEKCRREIRELGSRNVTWNQLMQMKYLNNVIKEALRLWPPVSINSRGSTCETVLPRGGGKDGLAPILVPKGTICRYNAYIIHRRKDLFGPDADEFRPERWEDLRANWEYIPFSAGPRICLGQQDALTQLLLTLYRVLQRYEKIEPRDDGPLRFKTSINTSFPYGVLISLTPAADRVA